MINTNKGLVKPSGVKIRAEKSPPNLAIRPLLVGNLKKSSFTEKIEGKSAYCNTEE